MPGKMHSVRTRRNPRNGYMVYPSYQQFFSLTAARKAAKKEAKDGGYARIENNDSLKTVAEYRRNPAPARTIIRGWVRAKAVKIVRDNNGRAVSVKIKT